MRCLRNQKEEQQALSQVLEGDISRPLQYTLMCILQGELYGSKCSRSMSPRACCRDVVTVVVPLLCVVQGQTPAMDCA